MTQRTELFLVIDTDAYSGNFERQLASFCTGEAGETHGREEAAEFRDLWAEFRDPGSNPFPSLVGRFANDHGSEEVGHIWPTPGRVNDGMGTHMDRAEFDALPDRASRHAWPCYESVAIMLADRPDRETLDLVRKRAETYAARGAGFGRVRQPFRILGLRLVTRVTTVEERSEPV